MRAVLGVGSTGVLGLSHIGTSRLREWPMMGFVSFTVLYGLRSFVCLSGWGKERSTSGRDCAGSWVWGVRALPFGVGLGVWDLGTGAMCRGSDVKDQAMACST